jgi:hypothetical protein
VAPAGTSRRPAVNWWVRTMGAFWSVWHLLAAAAVFLVPIQFEHGAVWTAPHAPVVFSAGLALAYLACAAALFLTNATASPLRRERWWLSLSVFGVYFLSLLVTKTFYSRSMLLIGLACRRWASCSPS